MLKWFWDGRGRKNAIIRRVLHLESIVDNSLLNGNKVLFLLSVVGSGCLPP